MFDTLCTCESLVVLVGHVVHMQGCTCGSLGELLVTCETLPEFVVMWCTFGAFGVFA